MKSHKTECRRDFLKASMAGGLSAIFAGRMVRSVMAQAPAAPPVQPTQPAGAPTQVAVTNGDQRTDNVFRGLKALEKQIAASIGKRRVVIKPNNVSITNQLAATHADALAGILEFLKSIGKLEGAIIAESALGNTMQGFQNFGYTKLADKYNVKLVDLDQEKYQTILAFNESDVMPHAVRVSSMLANQEDNFIISACMLKTHDRAVATMSIKNIILGAPLKLPGANAGPGQLGVNFGGRGPAGAVAGGAGGGDTRGGGAPGRGGRGFGGNDKGILHGGGSYGINVNLAMLAPILHPSLSVIDGYAGMEGNGPIGGTAVDHRVCVVGTDYVAADSVGATLMGIDPMDIGYINYLAKANVGEADLAKMEIVGGGNVEKLARKYQLGQSVQQQFGWKSPARVTAVK